MPSMEVTVIGRWGGCCRAGEACSGYLVRSGGASLLLDCGSGVVGRLQLAAPLASVDHVVVSHWHADHCGDAGVLLHGRLIQTIAGEVPAGRPLTFYAPPQEPDLGRLTWEPYASSQAVDEGSEICVGDLSCTFMRTRHPVACLAAKVRDRAGRTLVYTADGALTDGLAAFCTGADLVVAECSLYAGTDGSAPGHMNADDVAELARRANPGTLVLSHLPLYGDVGELLATVRAGWDGDVRLAGDMASYAVGPAGAGSCGRAGTDGGRADGGEAR